MKALSILVLVFTIFAARAEESIKIENLRPLVNAEKIVGQDKVLVYFWASWCPDCREKLTHGTLQALQKEFPKVKIVTVNSDREESRGKSFSETEKISMPVYRDDEKSLAKNLKLFAVPAWAVLEKGADGKWLVKKSTTGSDLEDMRAELKRYL